MFPRVGLEPGRSYVENVNDDSQRLNYLNYCCVYDAGVHVCLLYLLALMTLTRGPPVFDNW